MRFAHAHKTTSYAMVMFAFLALILSGELGVFASFGGFIAIVASWFWEPPRIRFDRVQLMWTILTLAVFAWTAISFFTSGEFLIAGAEFIVYLTIAKLFNRRQPKDYLHAYVLSFLMLVAGTALNTEFTYGVCFLGYVVFATWALILFHLRREMEETLLVRHAAQGASSLVEIDRVLNSRRIVGRSFFVGTAAVSLVIFAAASVLFLAIPRIGFGLFFSKSRGGVTMTGFSDGVQLGGHGTIKNDSTVVMRVQVDSIYEGRKAPYIHWRGVAFDRYSNGQWSRSREAPQTLRQVIYPRTGVEQHHMLYDQDGADFGQLNDRLKGALRQEIYLEPIGYDVLFGASMPLAFEFPSSIGRQGPRRERNDEMRFGHSAGTKYVVFSEPSPPHSDILRQAGDHVPPGYDLYLGLPPEINPRVYALAKEITRDATNDYDRAVAIEAWLKQNLGYTLEMVSPGNMEPVEFFVFERRLGHCEYFSSAMAILGRAVGVPIRNVNGFLGGEWNEYDDYIAVRAGDAHSWVEVFFPGHGWVTFDPTPSGEIDRLGRGDTGVGSKLKRFFDSLRFKWFQWVIEYDLYRQLSFFKKIGGLFKGGSSSVKSSMRDAKAWFLGHRKTFAVLIGSIFALALFFALWSRRRSRGHKSGRKNRSAAAIEQVYRRATKQLGRRAPGRPPSQTPREHAAALAAADIPGARAFAELTELYYAETFGPAKSADAAKLARAQTLLAEIITAHNAPPAKITAQSQ